MSTSLVYRNAWIYTLVMRTLYGKHYGSRSSAVARLIPRGSSVLDVCCGPGTLFEHHLRAQEVRYHGLDCNPRFIARVERLGGTGRVCDIAQVETFPEADYVIIQASLYHFLPNVRPLIEKLERAAREALIVAEPIRNLAASSHSWLAALASRQTNPGLGAPASRFDEASLDALFADRPAHTRHAFLIPGGREKIYVLNKPSPA